jgi:DNA polymerase-2
MTLWLIEPNQKRHRLIDRSFVPCFYVHGPGPRLSRLRQALEARARVSCALTERGNIWDGRPLTVLQVAVHHPPQYGALVRFTHRFDPSLRLYNSDLMLAPLYCWEKGVFPLARIEVEVEQHAGAPLTPFPSGRGEGAGFVRAIECRDDEWKLDFDLPPLELMRVRLEGLAQVDPRHGRRGALEVQVGGDWRVLDDSQEPVAAGFERLLRSHDPDLILSEWGDSTLFPGLLRTAASAGVELSLNRDPARGGSVERTRARSYVSYGRVLFKGSATTLFGRLHVDVQNSFIADQCELEGLWELVRVTKLPVQYAARTTTGTGISYMQMELAYRDGVLIPEQKAEPEGPKHPHELLLADRGGLVFSPRLGFFTNVGELDFVSEYPSIMARFNVSPETVNCPCCPQAPRVPELGYRICQRRRGITSRVVERLIEKRQQYKQRMSQAPVRPVGPGEGDANPPCNYKLRRSALKWLLVCCFGYTGYKNARFGKIEAHEAINALAREKLLVAKETAEQQGFRVLHALVDSLYTQKEGARREDYEFLAREIGQRTGLPLALEALYRYVVFLPSKQDPEIPVPNRFFCVSEEGELKVRGLECRKHDTPPLVARMQQEALEILAEARDFRTYSRKLEEARQVLDRYLERVEEGNVGVEELVISRRLTRPPGEYQKNGSTAIAARQLDRAGVKLRPGETIEYILTDADATLPDDRVRALTLWEPWRGYDVNRYQEALREAFQAFTHYAPAPKAGDKA